jgi:hypothetical protein
MNERKDERWLDDQLRRVIHGDTVRFDAQAWKQKHPEEYQRLIARSEQHVGWGLPHRRTIARLAVAAAIVLATGLFVLRTLRPEKPISSPGQATDSSAEMMSMMSLRLAYEQGGFDELDRQLQDTLDEFGPRSSGVSLQEPFLMREWIEESKGIEL